jgi:predicted ATPase/DNA-binding SARP family transcriptional activator
LPGSNWFTVLGPVRAWHAGVELDAGAPQQRAVLAVLLLRRSVPASVEDLIDALWEEQEVPSTAASTVRTYISRLRHVLDHGDGTGPVIRSMAGGYQLDLSPDELDLTSFRRHLDGAERAHQAGDIETQAREQGLALELWHGTPLAGVPGPYARRQRASLEQLWTSARTARLRAELDLGEVDRLLPELAEMSAEHPLDEQLREMLITGLYRSGRQADALAAYQDTRSTLARELGTDPGRALQALHEQILRADPALMLATGTAASPRPARPGSQPQGGGQAVTEPTLPTYERQRPQHNLPLQGSSFIGRDTELAAVRSLMAGSRLVTLVGTGGAGKTRLAVQAAAGLPDDQGSSVRFADLSALQDPVQIAATVADVLGVHLEPGRPPLEALTQELRGQSLLVVLDSCEHLIGACAKLVGKLMRDCPGLALLATSREPLCIAGEWVYRVPPLSLPVNGDDMTAIRASEAVRLLEDRAASHGMPLAQDEETTVLAARICQRLDGIPLAIELAAAQLRMMSASELEARLDERFALLTSRSRVQLPRHQTLRATVDWSWELLTGPERAVLARLSVFTAGFSLAAAKAVAASEEAPGDLMEHLGALVDKSLVQFDPVGTGPGQYRLLETIRQYATGQLNTLGPAVAHEARMAHRDHCLTLAGEAARHLDATGQTHWLEQLDSEPGNLQAVIARSLTQPDPEPGSPPARPDP